MINFLLPSNEIHFKGSYTELLDTIKKIDGVMEKPGLYHCTMLIPDRFHHTNLSVGLRGRLSFRFRFHTHACSDGFKLMYKVFPGVRTTFLLLAILILVMGCVLKGFSESEPTMFAGLLFSSILIIVIYFLRKKCIARFVCNFQAKK